MGAIQEVLNKFGLESVQMFRSNIAQAGQNASGETSRSIESKTPTETKLIVDADRHIYVLETGRRPGKMPPVSAIKNWLQSKSGVTIEGTIESASFGIAKFIANKGTKLFQEGGRKDIITPVVDNDARYDQLTNDIADISLNLVVNKIDETIS